MNLPAGTRLGPYEILGAIGAGGMGEVYSARDTRLERTVAVKILPPHLSDSSTARQRLEREARAVSSLSHANICALYDVGHEDGKDFLVMEYLEGQTLAERITQGPLPLEETLHYATQIADALDDAHRNGVIHRDLKPGNIMLTKDGAKLLDFGLAKAAVPAGTDATLAASPTMTTPLTVDGTIVGTFQYMSPEQLEGKEADVRSDIFAFGAVLHEMATGRKAFEGPTQASLIASILKEQPSPISTVQPKASPALERLVQTCMVKDPDQRRQSMRDVLLELKWIAEAGPDAGAEAPGSAPGRPRARLAWITAAILGLAAVALAIVAFRLASRPETVVRAFIPPPPGTVYALSGPRPGPVEISPDGTKLAFVTEDEEGSRVLWVRNLDALSGQPLAGTEGAIYPFWSPDSETIAFFAAGKLRKIAAAGGPVLSLCDASNGKGGSWNADGVIVFAPSHEDVIHRVPEAGGEPVPVTELNEERADNSHRFPVFLPDGNHFLYYARAGAGQQATNASTVMIGSLGDEGDHSLFTNLSHAVYASGYLLFARENALMARPFDPDGLKLTGDAFPIANEVVELAGASRGVFTVSDNGILAYQAKGAQALSNLVWFDAEGIERGTLGEPADFDSVSLSPDGKAVAVEIWDADQGATDLWIYDVDRGIRTRFTFDPSEDENPVWSPDGERIVFKSDREGTDHLYVNTVGGGEKESLVLQSEKNKTALDWSKDGRHILLRTELDIWALPMIDDAEPFPVVESEFAEILAVFSPDSRWIAYTSNESGQPEVYATSFPKPGRKWQISTDGGYVVGWSDDGKEIYYAFRNQAKAVEVTSDATSLRVGAERVLLDRKGGDGGDISGDGQRMLVEIPVGAEEVSPLTLVVNWTAELEK